jgi:hypothetical protein
MRVSLAILLFAGFAADQAHWPTLREVLAKHQIKADDFADADRQITSFEVRADPDWFAIAYYWHTGTGLLPDELRLRTWDRTTGKWRVAEFGEEQRQGGSPVRMARAGGRIYLDLHLTPSAGRLLVLTEDLEIKRRIAGWSSLILRDGRVVYENNMVHFAPYHPGSVSLYDPRSDRETRLFPAHPDPELPRRPAIDRSIGEIRQTGADEVTIQVTEEDRWWVDAQVMAPIGPARKFSVTCTLSALPICTTGTK